MAYDKVIDSAKLDADITTIADAIRARSGASGKLAFPNGMADVVRSITSGTELPTLTNPGSASDLAEGKQLIDGNGNIVNGSLVEENVLQIWENVSIETDDGTIEMIAPVTEDCILRNGSHTRLIANSSAFGNAAPSNVAQGVTFTSENGIKIEGSIPVVTDEARYFAYDIWDTDTTEMDREHLSEYPNCVQILGNISDDMIIRDRVGMYAYVPKSVFGDASPSDVRKGVTFTASGGVRAEGTMEVPTDEYINSLINNALEVIENGTY